VADPAYEYLLSDTDGPVVDEARTAIGARYEVASGPRRPLERTWLDTFDGRLQAAGLTLMYLPPTVRRGGPPGDRQGELVLSDGGATIRQPATARWPRLIDGVPTGPVADRLRPVVGIRALLPIATVRGSVVEWRIRDAEDKTVLRAYLSRTAVANGNGAALPMRFSVIPVRGYQRDAGRVAQLLATVAGVTAAAPELELILARGAGALAATPPPVPISAGQDAAVAVAGLLLHLLTTIEVNVPGTVGDVDTEFLHDLRVAVRRTRAALKLVGDALPGELAPEFAPQFTWLGDLTTPMRDLDTLLLGFEAMAAQLVEADHADLEPLRSYLGRMRTAERRRLVAGLRSARFTGLTAAWRGELTALVQSNGDRAGGGRLAARTVRALAADRIGRAYRRVVRRAAAVRAGSPPEALHDLRKRCKELRYILDLFVDVCRPAPYRALIRELKVVQDQLGEFQDAEVHGDTIRTYAGQMLGAGLAPASTLLAMGELVARFGAHQRSAAARSVERAGRLTTEENRRRMAGLVRPA
jgi:CHAD domain-containing protein